jgi:hypothetical protein
MDTDDFAAAGGAVGFEAPLNTRADQIVIRGVRPPYHKFQRNPTDGTAHLLLDIPILAVPKARD